MQKMLSLTVLWALAAGCSALAITADQKVTAVTVYPDRALVTRGGSVKLAPGVQAVVFENLPAGLDEDSVRAKASSEGKLKILGVEIRRDYKTSTPSPASKQLQDDVTKLDDQIHALADEQGDLQRRSQFLDKIRDKVAAQSGSSGTKEQPATVENIAGLFNLYGGEIAKISKRQHEIEISLRDLNKQKTDKAGQLSLLQEPSQPNTRSAIVTVDAGESISADLQVTYLMTGAGWEPQYDAYADPATKKVALTCYGVVRQSTGEDWNDVALVLSSAVPSTAARLPEMGAWTIDLASAAYALNFEDQQKKVPAKPIGQNSLTIMNGGALPAPASPTTTPPPPSEVVAAQFVTAEVRTLGPSATFVVPARTSIPNDGQPHWSAISVQSLLGDWTYEAAPKLAAGAFLKTRVTNSSGGPLLGGGINVFLGNDFIGKSRIGLVAANASFDLFLGTDENIKVTRKEGLKREETGGIITRSRIFKRSFVIAVENFKTTGASFKVRDQLPVSKNEQVKVTVDKAVPAFNTPDKNTGEVVWEFKLKPGEKQEMNVEYEVAVPTGQSVAGI